MEDRLFISHFIFHRAAKKIKEIIKMHMLIKKDSMTIEPTTIHTYKQTKKYDHQSSTYETKKETNIRIDLNCKNNLKKFTQINIGTKKRKYIPNKHSRAYRHHIYEYIYKNTFIVDFCFVYHCGQYNWTMVDWLARTAIGMIYCLHPIDISHHQYPSWSSQSPGKNLAIAYPPCHQTTRHTAPHCMVETYTRADYCPQ